MRKDKLSPETYEWAHEMLRIANRAAKRAQEENQKKGFRTSMISTDTSTMNSQMVN